MIYTVTFNPSLDYIVGTEGFQLGKYKPDCIRADAPREERESTYPLSSRTWGSRARPWDLRQVLPERRSGAGWASSDSEASSSMWETDSQGSM